MPGGPAAAQAAANAAATPSWKAAAISARGRPAARSSKAAATRSAPRIAPPSVVQAYGAAAVVAGQLLQLDRGLALVAHPLAHPEQRRHGVEEAPGARRERRVDLEALAHERPALERHRSSGPLEIRGRHPPRLPDRGLAAGQRHRLEMGDPLERGEVAAQQLAAPERPVRSHPGPVEDDGQRLAGLAVLGEAGGRVSVVVLHLDERQALRRAPTSSRGTRDGGRRRPPPARRRACRGRARDRCGTRDRRPRCRDRRGGGRGTPRLPRATQNVLFSSAPAATTARRRPAPGAGAAPARGPASVGPGRRPGRPSPRSGDGSAGRGRGTRRRSRPAAVARPRRRSRSARRSGCRSSSRAACRRRGRGGGGAGCRGASAPSHGDPAATDGATGASARRRTSTIGRATPCRSALLLGRQVGEQRAVPSSSRRAASPRGASCARRRATASSSVASQARW